MKISLRILSVLCYFLPFTFFYTTCHHGHLRFSYNKYEADKNTLLEINEVYCDTVEVSNSSKVSDSTNTDIVSETGIPDTMKTLHNNPKKFDDFLETIQKRIFFPTDNSLSGIGCILLFKDLFGSTAILFSLLVSLILLLAFKFLKSFQTKVYLLFSSLIFVTIFIIDCFIVNVTLLWGTWSLLVIIVLQLLLEFKDKSHSE